MGQCLWEEEKREKKIKVPQSLTQKCQTRWTTNFEGSGSGDDDSGGKSI